MISSASAAWNKVVQDASQDYAFDIYLEKQTNCLSEDLHWFWRGHRALAIFNQDSAVGFQPSLTARNIYSFTVVFYGVYPPTGLGE